MSAPNAGRQSPELEQQSGKQGVEAPAGGDIGAAPSETHAKEVSDDHKLNALPSNPTGPLEDAAHEKINDGLAPEMVERTSGRYVAMTMEA
ncbi:MAG: hypothetical protein Q9191_000719 [Dirinaria sp. TL-2023a]